MEIILCILYAALFVFLIYRWRFFSNSGISKRFLIGVFFLKIAFGVGLTLIYSHYYQDRTTADVFKYYDDSEHMYNALKEQPGDYFKMLFGVGNDAPEFDKYYSKMYNWKREFENQVYNDHQTMIRLNAFFRLLSFGYFHIHTIFMCFLSLIGLVGIYHAFSSFFEHKRKLLVATIFLIPSLLFWASPVLKEGMVILAMGLMLYSVFGLMNRKSWVLIFPLLVSLLILLYIKIYVLLAIIPALLGYAVAQKWSSRRPLIPYAVILIIGSAVALNLKHISPQYDVLETIEQKQIDFVGLANGGVYLEKDAYCIYVPDDERDKLIRVDSNHYQLAPGSSYPKWQIYEKDTTWVTNSTDTVTYLARFDSPPSGSRFDVTPLQPTLWGFIKNIPEAIHNALFRPWIFQATGMLELLAALESLVITIFIVVCILLSRKLTGNRKNLFWMCLTFSIITLLLIGWVTPISGAIVRYRVPVYPMLLPALLLLLNTDKLPSSWRKLLS